MFLKLVGNILLPGKQILFPQQCFHGWANVETFEETSRITDVSATMFPSLPRALVLSCFPFSVSVRLRSHFEFGVSFFIDHGGSVAP
jgi:hypothetical protein